MRGRQLGRWVCLGCASGCVALLGCSGANNPSPTRGAAGGAATSTTGGAPGSLHSAPSSAGSAGAPQAGSTSASGNSSTGGVGAAAGGASSAASGAANAGAAGMADTRDFSHGSRLVIPQTGLDPVASIYLNGSFPDRTSVDDIDVTTATTFADGPGYPRQFEVSFGMSYLSLNTSDANAAFSTRCLSLTGMFEVATVAVKEDTGGTGAHLSIEQTDGHYILTHDGPGEHQVRVTGTFRATNDATQTCPLLAMGPVAVPIAYTSTISIRTPATLTALPPSDCATPPVMLSGHSFAGLRITMRDDTGQAIYPANASTLAPFDVTVETEKPAQIVEGNEGYASSGIVVTGETQMVRLTTRMGTLFSYQLADASAIDGWELKWFSSPVQDIKSPLNPLDASVTPAVASGKELAATAKLKVGGVPVCTPIVAADVKTTLLTKSVCDIQYEFGNFSFGVPGFVATFLDPAGTCQLELSVPGSNHGQDLSAPLTAILQPAL